MTFFPTTRWVGSTTTGRSQSGHRALALGGVRCHIHAQARRIHATTRKHGRLQRRVPIGIRYALPRDLGERVDVLRVVELLVDNMAVVASKSCHNFIVSTV